MVGLVVVGHSRALAVAAVALASEMVHDRPVPIEVAAGLDDTTFGTDATAIMAAISKADRGDGVVVLMDLGSALLSTELALELLEEDVRERVTLSAAPLVEGLVAAVVSAAAGAPREEIAAEAENALAGKQSQLGRAPGAEATPAERTPEAVPTTDAAGPAAAPQEAVPTTGAAGPAATPPVGGLPDGGLPDGGLPDGGAGPERVAATPSFVVGNRHGLHARPAARLVAEARKFDASVELRNATTGSAWVPAGSLSRVATLGALEGHSVELRASGPQSREATDALLALAARAFDEAPPPDESSRLAPSPSSTALDQPPSPPQQPPSSAVHQQPPSSAVQQQPPSSAAEQPPPTAAEQPPPTAAEQPPPPPPRRWAGTSKAPGSDNSAPSSTGLSAGAVLVGRPASPGIGRGAVWHLGGGALELPDRPGQGAAAERRRLDAALAEVRVEITAVRDSAAREMGASEAAIFDAHLLLLDDVDIVDEAYRLIDEGRAAPQAWAAAAERTATAFEALADPYLRARAADVRAVGDQVLRALLGVPARPVNGTGVLVAAELTPADAAALDPATVTGVLLAGGSPTSHGAILARTRGIPAVVGLGPAVRELAGGTPVVFDGSTGEVVVSPGAEQVAAFRARAAAQDELRRRAAARAGDPAVTRDGVTIAVGANLGSVADAAAAPGADMAGLVRTEFLFLDRDAAPGADEQEATYRAIAAALDGRRVTLRTLDVGGDKPLRYLPGPAEENPFLGVRGLRHSLAHPDLLTVQLRAMLRVARDYPVDIMFPMVSTVDEVIAARRLLGTVPDGTRVGIMVEVPAAALKAASFAPHIDFVSIGTNDLTQYALAAERGNPALAALADGLDPGVLRLIDAVCRAARDRFEVAVCGELAADPAAVPILAGLGVRELSMAPPMIPTVKELVRGLDLSEAGARATTALTLPSAAAVRGLPGSP